MNPPLTLIPVAPVGTRSAVVLCGGIRTITEPAYPPSPCAVALHDTRIAFDMTLRETARVLGLSPMDLSAIERGQATLSTEDWCRAWCALAADYVRRDLGRRAS